MSVAPCRIGIVGSAGVGKSSLGFELARMLRVPFLAAKEITKDILKTDHYDYASGVQVERFLAQCGRQERIAEATIDLQCSFGQFVTDRTVIDLAAYAVAEMQSTPGIVEGIVDLCRANAGIYTHLVLCPWGERPIGDNQLRTLNPWYQFAIHSLDMGFLAQWNLAYYVVQADGSSERAKEVVGNLLGGDSRS